MVSLKVGKSGPKVAELLAVGRGQCTKRLQNLVLVKMRNAKLLEMEGRG